jgi:predicted naringenin-chalcone synthase
MTSCGVSAAVLCTGVAVLVALLKQYKIPFLPIVPDFRKSIIFFLGCQASAAG